MKTVLAVAVACGLVYAQGSSPNGSYGFLLNEYTNDSSEADTSGFAVIGVMNFDGMGNATGTYTVVNGGSPSTSKSGTLTGTYSGNSNGTGTLNVTADSGGTLTFATVTTDQGNGFQMVLTASNFAIATGQGDLAGTTA